MKSSRIDRVRKFFATKPRSATLRFGIKNFFEIFDTSLQTSSSKQVSTSRLARMIAPRVRAKRELDTSTHREKFSAIDRKLSFTEKFRL